MLGRGRQVGMHRGEKIKKWVRKTDHVTKFSFYTSVEEQCFHKYICFVAMYRATCFG